MSILLSVISFIFSYSYPFYSFLFFFFFNDTATTEIYTLSLHDALPISSDTSRQLRSAVDRDLIAGDRESGPDRKSTRLNSSHSSISYAVFCLKKKKTKKKKQTSKKKIQNMQK